MLYGLSLPAKRKYSNLKRLVGWQIVKRSKKLHVGRVRVSPQGDEQLQGDFKNKGEGRTVNRAKVTLRDVTRMVSPFSGNSCVDAHEMRRGGRMLVSGVSAAVVERRLQREQRFREEDFERL